MPETVASEQPSLTKKAVSGTGWSIASTTGRQLLSIASLATVAKMLGPGAYGVMAMAGLLLLFVSNLRDLGTGTAIIQRPEVSHRLLSSLFWLNCLIGVGIAIAVAATSGLTARFFRTPALVPILCVLSVSFWLVSCGVVHNSLLMRELRFKALAFCDLTAAIISYLVALVSAYSGLGVWSLVLANVANSVATTLLYWVASSWKPSWIFDKTEIKSVMNFGLNLSGFIFLNYFNRNADNIVVGKFLGQTALGDYQMAYSLMLTPLQNISSVVAQATFPTFSKIQQDLARFRSAYVRQSMIVSVLTFPIMAGLGVLADPLIRAVLGIKWAGAIPIFKVLAPVGLVQSVASLVGQIYMARARTDLMLRWSIVTCALCITAFLVGVHFQAVGVAAAYCIVYLGILMYPGFVIPFRLINLNFKDFAAALFPQLLITIGMSGVCFVWLHALGALGIINPWVNLITTSLLGAILYICTMIFLRPPVIDVLEEILRGYRSPGLETVVKLARRLASPATRQWFTCPAEIQRHLDV